MKQSVYMLSLFYCKFELLFYVLLTNFNKIAFSPKIKQFHFYTFYSYNLSKNIIKLNKKMSLSNFINLEEIGKNKLILQE